jgi:hypothetical protein
MIIKPKPRKIRRYTNAIDLIRDIKKGKINKKWVWLDER